MSQVQRDQGKTSIGAQSSEGRDFYQTVYKLVLGVMTHGSSTQKMYPLIMVDIDNGATHFESMTSLEAKEVYLALNRLQYRYNTKVNQVYSDGGTKLTCSLLGKKSNFYQRKLGSLWGIYNNLPFCQFRKVCDGQENGATNVIWITWTTENCSAMVPVNNKLVSCSQYAKQYDLSRRE